MSRKAKPIPEGHHSVTPHLMIKGAGRAIDYYRRAFGAEEIMRMADPDGKVRHAEIRIGDSRLMISDEFPEEFPQFRSSESMGGSPMNIYLYVDDVDACCGRAIAAGGQEIEPVADQFYGIAAAGYGILSATCGGSRRTRRTSRSTKSAAERRPPPELSPA
jgi:PhnB protein